MRLALFDLDNTLLAGDSDYEWGQFLVDRGVLERESYEAQNRAYYDQYVAGTLDIHEFLGFALRPLATHARADLERWHAEFMASRIVPMIAPGARQLVRRHGDAGDLCAIITATNSFVTAPITHAFGIENHIGTDPEQINGQYTGRVAGLPSFKEGKVTRILAWLEARGQNMENFDATWFYSDSHNDLSLMKLVNHPVAVNADPILTEYAKANGWPLMSLR